MKTDDRTLADVQKTLAELNNYEDALDVLDNYDKRISLEFYSQHNNNSSYPKRVVIPLDKEYYKQIVQYIRNKREKLKQKLAEF